MDERHVELLRRNRTYLVKNLICEPLFLSSLLEDQMLTDNMKDTIEVLVQTLSGNNIRQPACLLNVEKGD